MSNFIRHIVTLKGACGRVYHTKEQVMQDWNEGKRFQDMANESARFSCRDRAYMYLTLQTRWIDILLSNGLYHTIQLSENNHAV